MGSIRSQTGRQRGGITSTAVEQSLATGWQLQQQGQFAQAADAYQRVLRIDQGHPEALHRLGLLCLSQGKRDEAVRYLTQAVAAWGDHPLYHNNLGVALQSLQQHAEAAAAFRRAIALKPGYADAYFNLGVALEASGQLSAAQTEYEAALKFRHDHADAYNNLGNIHKQLGRWEAAETAYRAAIRVRPASSLPHYNLGTVFHLQGRLDEARHCYEHTLALDPRYVDARYNLGLVHYAARRFPQAVECFQQVLTLSPQYAPAHNNLGLTCSEQGDIPASIRCFEAALLIRPDWCEALNNLASSLQRMGQLERAVACYRRALELSPGFAVAHHNLGLLLESLVNNGERTFPTAASVTLEDATTRISAGTTSLPTVLDGDDQLLTRTALAHLETAVRLEPRSLVYHVDLVSAYQNRGRLEEAAGHLEELLAVSPDWALAHGNLGAIYHELGRLQDAELSYHQALLLDPEFAEAHYNLGNIRRAQGRLEEAAVCYVKALQLRPDLAAAHNNLGTIWQSRGQFQQAALCYQRCLELRPAFAPAWNNLGSVQQLLGNFAESERCLRAALKLDPHYADAENNLGLALMSSSKLHEAEAVFRQLLRREPGHLNGNINLGALLKTQGSVAEAAQRFDAVLQQDPDNRRVRVLQATLLPVIYQSRQEMLEWRQRLSENLARLHAQEIRLDLTREMLPCNFYLAYQGDNDRDLQRDFARLYQIPVRERDDIVRLTSLERDGSRTQPRRPGKIRLGFVSKHLRFHTIGKLMRGLIANWSRDDFEVTLYSVGHHTDEMAQFLRERVDQYLEIPENVPAATRIIAAQQPDVLFYPDIGMDPMTYSLAFYRLAPVQCVTWGHPVTTGIDTIDYYLSSTVLEVPAADSHYTETLVRLPRLPSYYYRPAQPAPLKSRAHFGLSEGEHIYLCPQSVFKLHPDFDQALSQLLHRDPHGRVVLLESKYRQWNAQFAARFQRVMPEVADRIEFLPGQSHADFLNLLLVSDVMLDSFHFGGGNTTYEALAMGLPIVTCPSPYMRSRVTCGCYQLMELPDCVTESVDDYVECAWQLAHNRDFASHVRRQIQERSHVLFEDRAAVRDLEQFLRDAVEL